MTAYSSNPPPPSARTMMVTSGIKAVVEIRDLKEAIVGTAFLGSNAERHEDHIGHGKAMRRDGSSSTNARVDPPRSSPRCGGELFWVGAWSWRAAAGRDRPMQIVSAR